MTIQNQGNTAIGLTTEFNVGLWANRTTAPVVSTVPDQSQKVAGLAVGESKTVTFTVTRNSSFVTGSTNTSALGNFSARVFLDGTKAANTVAPGANSIAEANENNNAGGPLAWTVSGQPNLQVADISLSPASPCAGETVTFTVTVNNLSATCAATGTFNVGFWKNLGTGPASSTKPEQSVAVTDLPPNTTKTVTFSVSSVSMGTFSARAFVDGRSVGAAVSNQIGETNETDNAGGPFSWTVGGPDLVLSSFTVDKPISGFGENVTFSVVVTNQGTCPATKKFNVGLWKDLGVEPSVTTVPDTTSQTIDGLINGCSATKTFQVTGQPPGNFTARAFVDGAKNGVGPTPNQIKEVDESNNYAGPLPWTVEAPDLVVTDLTILSSSGPTAPISVTYSVTVKNTGPRDATRQFNVGLYENRNTPPGDNDNPDESRTIDDLPAGKSATVVFTRKVSAGSFNAGAFVDGPARGGAGGGPPSKQITESDETNNAKGPRPYTPIETPVKVTLTDKDGKKVIVAAESGSPGGLNPVDVTIEKLPTGSVVVLTITRDEGTKGSSVFDVATPPANTEFPNETTAKITSPGEGAFTTTLVMPNVRCFPLRG